MTMRTTITVATFRLSLLSALLVVYPQAALAQRPGEEQRANPNNSVSATNHILRTYEVGDLVVSVPDYGAPGAPDAAQAPAISYGGGGFGAGGGGFGGGGGGFGGGGAPLPPGTAVGGGGLGAVQSSGPDPMQIDFDSLIDAMVSVVAPNSWAENGGGDGVVKPVGAALAVWQTPEVHELIAEFLDMLRQGSAKRRTLSIDARWLMLDSQDLEDLVVGDERKVDPAKLNALTRRPTSMRGMTHCFSGQLVYLISGTRRSVVSGYIPVVGSVDRPDEPQFVDFTDGARITFAQFGGGGQGGGTIVSDRSVGYQPLVEKPNFGVLLEIRPTIMQGENVAVVDLKSTVTFPGQPTSDATAGSMFDPAMDIAPRVDRLAVEMQQLATTLRVPLGEPLLVGGMTYLTPSPRQSTDAPQDAAGQPAAASESPQLYLVLEIR
jgi:hypothetical protein